jgi:hypothetical protein
MVEVVQHAVVAIEALVHRAHARDETEMPFADAARGVTGGLHDLGESDFTARETVPRIGTQHAGGEPDTAGILARHQ